MRLASKTWLLALTTAFCGFCVSSCWIDNNSDPEPSPGQVEQPSIQSFDIVGTDSGLGNASTPAVINLESGSQFVLNWSIKSSIPASFFVYVTKDVEHYKDQSETLFGGGCGAGNRCGGTESAFCQTDNQMNTACHKQGEDNFRVADLKNYVSTTEKPTYMVFEACVIFECVTSVRMIAIK